VRVLQLASCCANFIYAGPTEFELILTLSSGTSKLSRYDVIIIGGGAAGLMCAITAGARGQKVLVLDHNDQVGAKILISGGGRCNFTNIGTTPKNFISQNPHFSRSALSRYSPQDFLNLVEKHGIAWHEKTLGQLFCDGSARQIVKMLLDECAAAHVDIRLNVSITDIRKSEQFILETSGGAFESSKVVLATGGLSIPKMGATGFAYDVARKFGLKVVTPKPGLVPLRASENELRFYNDLSGVSVRASARAGNMTFAENILFTHRGLSGPAILQASSYLGEGQPLHLDLMPDFDAAQVLKERKHARPKAEVKTILGEFLPSRLAAALGADIAIENFPALQMNALCMKLKNWTMVPAGTEGFAKAEVTTGGIDTDALSSKTMESRLVPGFYVIGEAVDVTGWLGGYNFQWAWASGWAAGQALASG
jgi:predicted Rossmann fold flavoprotein